MNEHRSYITSLSTLSNLASLTLSTSSIYSSSVILATSDTKLNMMRNIVIEIDEEEGKDKGTESMSWR